MACWLERAGTLLCLSLAFLSLDAPRSASGFVGRKSRSNGSVGFFHPEQRRIISLSPHQFFQRFGVEYLNEIRVPDGLEPRIRQTRTRQRTTFSPRVDRLLSSPGARALSFEKALASGFLWFASPEELRRRYRGKVRRGYKAQTIIAPVQGAGLGLFAAKKLLPGEMVALYGSILGPRAGSHEAYAFPYPGELFDDTELQIDASRAGNEARFINDNPELNASSAPVEVDGIWNIIVMAIAPIERYQQIFMSYGDDYWGGRVMKRLPSSIPGLSE